MTKITGFNFAGLSFGGGEDKYAPLTAALNKNKSPEPSFGGADLGAAQFNFSPDFKAPATPNFSNSFLNADFSAGNISIGTLKTDFDFASFKPSNPAFAVSTDIFTNFAAPPQTATVSVADAVKATTPATLTGAKLIEALKAPQPAPSFTNASTPEGTARLLAALKTPSGGNASDLATAPSFTNASTPEGTARLLAALKSPSGAGDSATPATGTVVSDINPNFVGLPGEGLVANATIPFPGTAPGPWVTPEQAAAALQFLQKLGAPVAKGGPVAVLTGAILAFLAEPAGDLKLLERELPGTKLRDENGVRALYDADGNALITAKKDIFGVTRWDVNKQNMGRYKQRLEDAVAPSKSQPAPLTGNAPAAVLPDPTTPRLAGVDYSVPNTTAPNTAARTQSQPVTQNAPQPTKQQLIEQTADSILAGLRAQGLPAADRNKLINELITWQRGKSGVAATLDQTAKDLRTLMQPGADGMAQKVLQGIISKASPTAQAPARPQTGTAQPSGTANATAKAPVIDVDWPLGAELNPGSSTLNKDFEETLKRTFAPPANQPAQTNTTQTNATRTTASNPAPGFDADGVTYWFDPSLRITPDMEYNPTAQTLSLINSLSSGNIDFGTTSIGDSTLFQRTTGPAIFGPLASGVDTYPFPGIRDPWLTPPGAGAQEEAYPEVKDPWDTQGKRTNQDDPDAPPAQPNGETNTTPETEAHAVQEPANTPPSGNNQPPNSNQPPRPSFGGTEVERDALIALAQLGVNLVSAGTAAIHYQFAEKRTSAAVDQDNVLQELSALQRDPDTYLRSNYTNSILGWDVGDWGYNLTGRLFEMEKDGQLTYFRRVPDDIYQNLLQRQRANGITSDKVFVNEVIDDGKGNRIPVWVEIRAPVRVEGYQYNGFTRGPTGDGSNFWDKIDFGGTAGFTYGVDEGYRLSGEATLTFDPTSSGISDRIRIAFPTQSQAAGIGYRTQDTTTFARASLAYRSEFNGARVRDITPGGSNTGLDGRLVWGESSLYFITGQRSRNRVDITLPTATNTGGAYARVRDTTFIEFGAAAVFFGTDDWNLNYYHEGQYYPNDLRDQVNILPTTNNTTGQTQSTFNKPTYRLIPGFENDVALQLTFNDGVKTMLAYRDVETLNEWFPGLTKVLGIDGALDAISSVIHPENPRKLDPKRDGIAALNVVAASGSNVPTAAALRTQANPTAVRLADGSNGQVVSQGNRSYLVVEGRNEVFDVTNVGLGNLRVMQVQSGGVNFPARLGVAGSFELPALANVTAPKPGAAGNTQPLAPNQTPSAEALKRGTSQGTITTADGLKATVTTLNNTNYAQINVGGKTVTYQVPSIPSLTTSVILPGATPSLVNTSNLSAGNIPVKPEDIIRQNQRVNLPNGGVAFFGTANKNDYALLRDAAGNMKVFDITGYNKTTIQQYLAK